MQRPGPRNRILNRDPRYPKASTSVSGWLNFTPASLSPAVWYDASDSSTITESSGAVSQWNDKSGNGRNLTQATSTRQPTLISGGQNNLNTISFDGTSDKMVSASFDISNLFAADLQSSTVYFVCKYGVEPKPSVESFGMQFGMLASTSRLLVDNRPGSNSFYDNSNSSSGRLTGNDGTAYGTSTIICFRRIGGGVVSVERNGIVVLSQASGSTATSQNGVISVGNPFATNNFQWFYGEACELFIFPRAMTKSESQQMLYYLNNKWGIF